MNLKKILTGMLIGAFVFGVGFSDVSAANDKSKDTKAQQTTEMKKPPQNSDGKNPPEPPKDSNGNPLPPPDRQNSDNQNNQQHKK